MTSPFDGKGPSRRGFLRLLLCLSAFLPARVLLAVPVGKAAPPNQLSAFAPYLDTLIPQDSTPSASQLGVDEAVTASARQHPRLDRLVRLGCAWLDEQAGQRGVPDFASLSELEREAVVALAERSPARSVPRVFFEFTRDQAFFHYYAQPAAWQGLGLSGPPQPLGFVDFSEPPREPIP